MLFPKTCQCECLSQCQRFFHHAYYSGKNYISLVENVLWAVWALADTSHQISRLRIESNFSLWHLENQLHTDGQDYRHVIHYEAAAEKEICSFLAQKTVLWQSKKLTVG